MKLRDALMLALGGLGSHWLRASMSAVAVLAGVAAVVLLTAIAQAGVAAKTASVEGLLPNLVVVYPGGISSSGVQTALATRDSLTSDDVTALSNQGYVPDAVTAVPTAGLRDTVGAGSRTWVTDVIGSTNSFAAARGYSIAEGRFLNQADVNATSSVVVLGQTAVDKLFPGVDPIRQTVRINNNPFTVIGVMAPRGYSGTYDQDDLVLTPISAAWVNVLPTGAPRIQQVVVQATSRAVTGRVKAEVTHTLLRRHDIANPADADFRVLSQHDLVTGAERVTTVMDWTLGAVGAVALGGGAVCILLLMLLRVAERTHEISVSLAIGAARADILTQFLTEALLLAGIAGALGIVLGVAATRLAAGVMRDLPAPTVTGTALAVAAAMAIIVGLSAGIYPALRAAKLRPTDAPGGL